MRQKAGKNTQRKMNKKEIKGQNLYQQYEQSTTFNISVLKSRLLKGTGFSRATGKHSVNN